MKRTIEIEDSLSEIVETCIESVKEQLESFIEENPDFEGVPCLNNDLDYSGAIHEIIDGAVPIYTKEINDLFYLHGEEFEEAFKNAGIGSKDDKWPNGWKPVAIYCYLREKVNEAYQEKAEEWVSELTKCDK